MKHSACRRLWAVLLLTVLLGSLLSAAAWAAPVTVDAGDVPVKTGSEGHIIVTVYDQEPGGAGTGGQITGSYPVAGVGINALRIGSVVELTTTTTGGTTVTTGTQVAFGLDLDAVVSTSTVGTLLGLTADAAIAADGSIHYFAPETVMNALEDADQEAIEDALDAAGSGAHKDVTGDDGKAEFTSLEHGLYLLAKSELPAEATTDLPPFLVSVPMYVDNDWQSTVYAYPKVRTATLELTKSATVDGVSTEAPDLLTHVSSGDTIHYTLSVTIPQNVAGAGASQGFIAFTVTDTNTAGTLEFDTSSVVVKLDDNILDSTDYTVDRQKAGDSSNDQILTVELTKAGLADLNMKLETAAVTFTITYSATVNTAVTPFQSALENTAVLTYRRGGTEDAVTDASKVTLYTYGIDLTKALSDSGTITEGAITFGLYSDEECQTLVSMTKAGQGYWQDAAGGVVGPGTLAVDTRGKLYLYGLKPGTYYLKEEVTMSGYTLLAQPITIVIEDADKDGTMAATVNGETAQVTEGVVSLTVENTKNQNGFTLPQTGGAGTLLAAAVGLGLVSAGVVLLTAVRRKKPQR